MAKVVEVRRATQVLPPIEDIVMILTASEAKTLRLILDCVGGDPNLTRRGDADNILSALKQVPLKWLDNEDFVNPNIGQVHFYA